MIDPASVQEPYGTNLKRFQISEDLIMSCGRWRRVLETWQISCQYSCKIAFLCIELLEHSECLCHSSLRLLETRPLRPKMRENHAELQVNFNLLLLQTKNKNTPKQPKPLVSWFLGFLVSKFQWYHNIKESFHVFWWILSSYSRFPRTC